MKKRKKLLLVAITILCMLSLTGASCSEETVKEE